MRRRLTAVSLALVLLGAGVGSAADLEVRVFTLKHRDPADASQAVQPMLSEEGSLTVQPKSHRLSVQDRPEVVERIARFLAAYDVPPPEFRLKFLLLRASTEPPLEKDASGLDADLLRRLRRMFRYARYVPLGSVEVRGHAGDGVSVALAGDYRVAFLPRMFQRISLPVLSTRRNVTSKTPAPRRAVRPPLRPLRKPLKQAPRPRVRLEHLQLLKEVPKGTTAMELKEILRTSIMISPGQRVVLGAAGSESADRALVLVIESPKPKGEGE